MIFTNDRLANILGSQTVNTTEHLTAFVCDEDLGTVRAAMDEVLRGEPVDDIEVRLVRRDTIDRGHDAQFCRFSLRALSDANGTVNGAIGCVQDVTDSVVLRQNLEFGRPLMSSPDA